MECKYYEITGKKFYQNALILGQVEWLNALVSEKHPEGLLPREIENFIDSNLSALLSIILVSDGLTQAEKVGAGIDDMLKLRRWFSESSDPLKLYQIGNEVITDFFSFNPPEIIMLIFGLHRRR